MARTVTRPTLTDVLVQQGILPKHTVDQILSRLGGVTAAFGQTLVSKGILSEDQLARALAATNAGVFFEEAIGGTWNAAVGLTFSAEGQMFVWEHAGRLWLVEDGVKQSQPCKHHCSHGRR